MNRFRWLRRFLAALLPREPEALRRARSMIGFEPDGRGPIRYRLREGFNGGRNPNAPHPASWSPPDSQGLAWSEHGAWTCDCTGFAMWCIGIDRYQLDFEKNHKGEPLWGGWINTNSMIAASKVPNPEWFEQIPYPEKGCLVVYGTWRNEQGKSKVGHVGVVSDFPKDWQPGQWRRLSVVHCSGGNDQTLGMAIAETDGRAWENPRKGSVFLRYLGPHEDPAPR